MNTARNTQNLVGSTVQVVFVVVCKKLVALAFVVASSHFEPLYTAHHGKLHINHTIFMMFLTDYVTFSLLPNLKAEKCLVSSTGD